MTAEQCRIIMYKANKKAEKEEHKNIEKLIKIEAERGGYKLRTEIRFDKTMEILKNKGFILTGLHIGHMT